jgi:hypothetical protein
MRSQKALVALLGGLVELLADESERNPAFANRLDSLLSALPEARRFKPTKRAVTHTHTPLPNVHAEWTARGETEFRLWLRDQPIATIRAIIRAQDLDPARRTSKWTDTEKLADFVADGMRARLARGSAFISTTVSEPTGE